VKGSLDVFGSIWKNVDLKHIPYIVMGANTIVKGSVGPGVAALVFGGGEEGVSTFLSLQHHSLTGGAVPVHPS